MKVTYLRRMREGNNNPNIYDIKLRNIRWKQIGFKPKNQNFSCYHPSSTIMLDRTGEIFVCSCNGHLSYTIGNILDFDSFEEVWTHPIALKLQENTKAGSKFKFCSVDCCDPRLNFNGYYQFFIGLDDSCNLQCPSCRTKMIHFKSGPVFDHRKKCMDKFIELLTKFDHRALINFGSDGEVFASKVYSDVIYNYIPSNDNHIFNIRTNGTLIDQNKLIKSHILNQLGYINISIDAGSEEVYKIVRRPGSWKTLLNNLDFLKKHNIMFELNFVLQKDNLYDLINWVNLCEHYGVKGWLSLVEDWYTWDSYEDHAVFLKNNVHYNDFLNIIKEVKSHSYIDNIVFRGEHLDNL